MSAALHELELHSRVASLDFDACNQRSMHRTMVGNVQELAGLFVRKVALETNRQLDSIQARARRVAVGTVLCMHLGVRHMHMHFLERPPMAIGKHLYRDGSARAERCKDQFVRIRRGVATAKLRRLIRVQLVWADRDVLDIALRAGQDGNDSLRAHLKSSSAERREPAADSAAWRAVPLAVALTWLLTS